MFENMHIFIKMVKNSSKKSQCIWKAQKAEGATASEKYLFSALIFGMYFN